MDESTGTPASGREFMGFSLAVAALREIGIPLSSTEIDAVFAVVRQVAAGKLTLTNSPQETLAELSEETLAKLAEIDPSFRYSVASANDRVRMEQQTAQRIMSTLRYAAGQTDDR